MLRVNLLEDADFRKDLLTMAKGVLREVAISVIGEALKTEGWLEGRVEAYFARHPVHQIIENQIRITRGWERPEIIKVLDQKIAELVKSTTSDMLGRAVSDVRTKMESQVREIVRSELRNVLGGGLK